MALNFPSTPTLNEVYTSGDFSWIWNGYAWDIKPQNLPSPTSNTGLYISSDGSNYIFAAAATSSNTVLVDTVTANTSVTINSVGTIVATTLTTTSNSQVTLDQFSNTAFRSARYQIQLENDDSYHSTEIGLIHDGSTSYINQYGDLMTNISLGTFDTTITLGEVKLLFTPANSTNTVVNAVRTTMPYTLN